MASRRRARECALQLLYQWEGERSAPSSLLPEFWKSREEDAGTRKFAEQLFLGAAAAAEKLDALIAAHSEHWRLERMAAIDRNLLRLAVYEMRTRTDVSPAVVINEALEIARRFSSADSVEFINGVLDAIRKAKV